MDSVTFLLTILGVHFFIAFVNIEIIMYFSGFNNDITKEKYKDALLFSDALYTTYNSVCDYKYASKINWLNAYIAIFVPAFNIVWLIASSYKLFKFYKHNF